MCISLSLGQFFSETLDAIIKGMLFGLHIGHQGPLKYAFPLEVFNGAAVVEKIIIIHDLTCFATLMGSSY